MVRPQGFSASLFDVLAIVPSGAASLTIIPIKLGPVNCFLVKQARTVLVDTGYPQSEARILDALKDNDIEPGDVSLILITHGHLDHFGSAALMKEFLKCPIAMHKLDASAGESGESVPFKRSSGMGKVVRPFMDQNKEYYYSFKPDKIIDDELDLWHYGLRGKVVSTPGHSAGSVSLVMDNGDAIVGDILMKGGITGNKAKMPLFYDSEEQIVASARKLLELGVKRFYLSHGGMLTDGSVKRFVDGAGI